MPLELIAKIKTHLYKLKTFLFELEVENRP